MNHIMLNLAKKELREIKIQIIQMNFRMLHINIINRIILIEEEDAIKISIKINTIEENDAMMAQEINNKALNMKKMPEILVIKGQEIEKVKILPPSDLIQTSFVLKFNSKIMMI